MNGMNFSLRESRPAARRRPVVTYALLVINLLVFAAAQQSGAGDDPEVLLDYGAMFSPLIADGQYWRLFTAMFLHADIPHIVFNGLGLLLFGGIVERTYGHLRFGAIYVIAGLAGSVLSFGMNSIAIGAGASGAIFGVLGALGAFFAVQRNTIGKPARINLAAVAVMAGISLAYGLVTPRIDNWAHLGGLIGGAAMGLALSPTLRPAMALDWQPPGYIWKPPPLSRWWAVPAAAGILALGAAIGTLTLPDNPYTRLFLAERRIEAGDIAGAVPELDEALRLERTLARAYYLRGTIRADQGNVDGAVADLGAAIRYSQAGDRAIRSNALALMMELRGRR
jgi:rhomboid protease GluP